jgi:hypothetical protein
MAINIGTESDGRRWLPVPLPAEYKSKLYAAITDIVSRQCGEGRVISDVDGVRTLMLVVRPSGLLETPFIVRYSYSNEDGIIELDFAGAYAI